MLRSGKLFKYSLLGTATFGAIGTWISFKRNQYNFNSVGIVRFGRASYTTFTIVYYYKSSLHGCGKKLDRASEEYLALRSKIHKMSAEKLLALCQTNKGVYIKVGQHIGALHYILPAEYVDTMKVLHSQAPSSTIQEVYQVIKEDLQKDPDEIFESIDPKPIGAASLAQVHKAKLKDGNVVALKVQHLTVRGNSIVDVKTMEILASVVSWLLPEFNVRWLVEETKRNIPLELDFKIEVENTEKARHMYSYLPWLKIPKIHREFCSTRVIASEFVQGGQVNDLNYIQQNNINPFEISEKLGQLYGEMIFKQGFVHSDPHPGNILVQKTEQGSTDIILLDHGLYATLSDNFRYKYAQLWISILNNDMQGVAIHSSALGVHDLFWLFASMVTGRSWEAIQSGLHKTKFDDHEKELVQREFPNLLSCLSDVLSHVNREMILIFKTNDLLRGIEHTLQTNSRMESFSVTTKICVETVYAEKRKRTSSMVQKIKVTCAEQWALFKLKLYFNFLKVQSWINVSLFAGLN